MKNNGKRANRNKIAVALAACMLFLLQSCQPDDWVKIYVPDQNEEGKDSQPDAAPKSAGSVNLVP